MERRTVKSESTAKIITDPKQIEQVESENALRQFDHVVELVQEHGGPDADFRLRPFIVLELNRLAVMNLEEYAGKYRPHNVSINNSDHSPPPYEAVPTLVNEMCEYVNDHWESETAIHLAAYLLWRVNWIHPFANGNGRTARAVSYLVLCIRLGFLLPGDITIPDQIAEDKQPYYRCLDAADEAAARGEVDVREMEEYISELLAKQLLDTYRQAGGHNA